MLALGKAFVQDVGLEKVLVAALDAQVYSLSAWTVFAKTDRYHLGSVRWAAQGSRQAVLCSEAGALCWLKSWSMGAQVSDVPSALKELTLEGLSQLRDVSADSIFSCTVGEGDVLMLCLAHQWAFSNAFSPASASRSSARYLWN